MSQIDEDRLERVLQILKGYGLGDLYSGWQSNPGDKNAYHNNQHQAIVALHAHRLGTQHLDKFSGLTRALFVAGLFHDFDHTGNPRLPDSANIERAIVGWRNEVAGVRTFTGHITPSVESFIRSTVHNFDLETIPVGETREAARIIRECDYAYLLEPDKNVWVPRLSEETGRIITREVNDAFLSSLEFRYLEVTKEMFSL